VWVPGVALGLPAGSVAVAVTVRLLVPSTRPETSRPLTVQAPPVAVTGPPGTVLVPSLTVRLTLVPGSAVPENDVEWAPAMLTVGKAVTTGVAGAMVSLLPVWVPGVALGLPAGSVAVAVTVRLLVPSTRLETSRPLTVQAPPVAVTGPPGTVLVPSLTVRLTLVPGSAVPENDVE